MEERFYFCDSCGNLLFAAIASGVIPYCCGGEMTLLEPNVSDGNSDKHLPVVSFISSHSMMVRVGSDLHPMTADHNIRFVCLVTNVEAIVRYLNVDDPPEVCLHYDGDPVAIYAYCNVHGLWRSDLKDYDSCRSGTCMAK